MFNVESLYNRENFEEKKYISRILILRNNPCLAFGMFPYCVNKVFNEGDITDP